MGKFFYFIGCFLFFTSCDVIVEEEGPEYTPENKKIETIYPDKPSKTSSPEREKRKKVPELTDQPIKPIN